jgi:MFS family permease
MDHLADYNAKVELRWRFNLNVLLVVEAIWGAGAAFVSQQALLPVFLRSLGASGMIIGLLPALMAVAATVPQLITAYYTEHLPKKKTPAVWLHVPVLIGGYILAFTAFHTDTLGYTTAIVLVLISQFIQSLAFGFIMPVWFAMVDKIYPVRLRGKAFGIMMFVSGLMGVLAAKPAKWLIDHLDHPLNYGYCFLAGAVLWTISLAIIFRLREVRWPAEKQRPGPREYFRRLLKSVISNRPFLGLLANRSLVGFASMAGAFSAVWAVEKVGMSEGSTALLIAAGTIAGMVGSPIAGWVGDHTRYKPVVIAATLCMAISCLLLLFGKVWLVYAAFAVGGLGGSAFFLAQWRLTVKLCPHQDATGFLGLGGALTTPAGALGPIIGGALVDRLAQGYQAVFILSAVLGGLAALVAWLFITEANGTSQVETQRESVTSV